MAATTSTSPPPLRLFISDLLRQHSGKSIRLVDDNATNPTTSIQQAGAPGTYFMHVPPTNKTSKNHQLSAASAFSSSSSPDDISLSCQFKEAIRETSIQQHQERVLIPRVQEILVAPEETLLLTWQQHQERVLIPRAQESLVAPAETLLLT
jgi:hypothetical protein